MLVVKAESIRVPNGVTLTSDGMETLNLFKAYSFLAQHTEPDNLGASLCLIPFDGDKTVEEILENGSYDFDAPENPHFEAFKKLADELEDAARFFNFTVEDIFATT